VPTVLAVPSRPLRLRLASLVASALLALALPGLLPELGRAEAQQPYGPVVLDVSVREGEERDDLAVRVTGLRPNSSVEAVSDGGVRVTGLADGAGVVELEIALPTSIDVEVRGIAADGSPLVLLETVAFPRYAGNGTTRTNGSNGTVVATAPTGVTVVLPWMLAVLGLIGTGVATARLQILRRGLAAGADVG
jgi:hypothetical protein